MVVQALLFDVFGTVVDWRSSLIGHFKRLGKDNHLTADWPSLVDDWRAEYEPSMAAVRSGQRPWTTLEQLHRESLEKLLPRYGLSSSARATTDALKSEMVRGWHFLDPWPDAVAGLARLKAKYIIGTLSNGSFRLLTDMAKYANLGWDAVLCSDLFRRYKPDPAVYLGASELLDTAPENIMLVAAHNYDLAAARKCGYKTGFVARPSEYGPRQKRDFKADADWDVIANDFNELAGKLGA